MKHIVFNASSYSGLRNGINVYTKRLLNELLTCGQSCLVYTFRKFDNSNIFNEQLILKPFFPGFLFRNSLSLYRILWNIFILPTQISKNDALFSFSSYGTPFHKRQVIVIHDLISLNFPRQNRLQYLYFRYIMPFIISSCKQVVVISEFTKSEVIKYYNIDPRKIRVVYNGVDRLPSVENTRSPHNPKVISKRYFLMVGASYSHKNAVFFFSLAKIYPEIQFVVVGKADDHDPQYRMMENIIFLKDVSDNELRHLYKNALLHVYPSLYEGFGLPPAEAAFENCATVANDIPVLKEVYGETLIYVSCNDLENAKVTIDHYLDNENMRNDMCQQCQKRVRNYTWENTANEICKIIFEI